MIEEQSKFCNGYKPLSSNLNHIITAFQFRSPWFILILYIRLSE